jgi:hypothetical protein
MQCIRLVKNKECNMQRITFIVTEATPENAAAREKPAALSTTPPPTRK